MTLETISQGALLRRNAVHLSPRLGADGHADAVCRLRSAPGGGRAGSGAVVPVRPDLHGGEFHTAKAGAQRVAAELGLMLIAPDTSPRGEGVPGDPAGSYDFGLGAGFYVDATQAPYAANYRMRSYIEEELPALIAAHLPADMGRQGISGHSMGGHGAITIALRNAGRFRSVSALAPIAAPMQCPWGQKALGVLYRTGSGELARIRFHQP